MRFASFFIMLRSHKSSIAEDDDFGTRREDRAKISLCAGDKRSWREEEKAISKQNWKQKQTRKIFNESIENSRGAGLDLQVVSLSNVIGM